MRTDFGRAVDPTGILPGVILASGKQLPVAASPNLSRALQLTSSLRSFTTELTPLGSPD